MRSVLSLRMRIIRPDPPDMPDKHWSLQFGVQWLDSQSASLNKEPVAEWQMLGISLPLSNKQISYFVYTLASIRRIANKAECKLARQIIRWETIELPPQFYGRRSKRDFEENFLLKELWRPTSKFQMFPKRAIFWEVKTIVYQKAFHILASQVDWVDRIQRWISIFNFSNWNLSMRPWTLFIADE